MSETTLDRILSTRQDASRDIVDVDEPAVKLVVFELSGQWFAFHGERIREILAHADVFFVPGCPASLAGVINVRGDIESVVLLDAMLQLPPPAGQPATILLGQGGGMTSGIAVERVIDVLDVPQSRIQPPPETLPDHLRPLVLGLLDFQGHPVALLDLERLFADYAQGLG